MKKIYLAVVVLLAVFMGGCEKDNGNGNNNNGTSGDGVWQFVSQEVFYGNGNSQREDNEQILQCLKKSTITLQKGVCIFQQYIPVIGNPCKVQKPIQGVYKLTDKTLEITFDKTVVKFEIAKKTDKEIVIKQEHSSEPGAYVLDTYMKK